MMKANDGNIQKPGMVTGIVLIFAGLLLNADPAPAHHSFSMFDRNQILERTATVKEFQFTNPHVWIQVMMENAEGEKQEWSIEGLGPNSLFRSGWRPTTFKPGDIIELKFHPMLDGSNGGAFIGAKFANGDTLGRWE